MEVERNEAVQTSIALAVADRSPPKNQWKKKYLILKRKCDQIDQVGETRNSGLECSSLHLNSPMMYCMPSRDRSTR